MFAMLSSPTKPPATTAVMRPGNKSWLIGDAWLSTPMPAVTLTSNMIQSSQNCGVFQALSTDTLLLDTSLR